MYNIHVDVNVNNTSRGLALLAPCCTRFRYLSSHSYIHVHVHMYAIRCYKQGCERADLAYMKSSKVKGTDYVNSTPPDIAVHSVA